MLTTISMSHVFLLSPAHCGGRRANLLLRPGATLPLALRLHAGELSLGEAFSFMSGLYFRGKLTYARAFGATGAAPAVFVITPTRGLLTPETVVSEDLLREFASVDVSADDPRYRAPLEQAVATLAAALTRDAKVILLGSVATGKYMDVLSVLLGPRLHYPAEFIGRGDMSRGGLLLRSAAAGTELAYTVFDPLASRRGTRPQSSRRLRCGHKARSQGTTPLLMEGPASAHAGRHSRSWRAPL
jgi:hypothetical protein